MFGVLVVQNEANELGYLVAFSGKLGGKNHHSGFVPPLFDMLTKDGYFRKEEEVLNDINAQIQDLENNPEYLEALLLLKEETEHSEQLLEKGRKELNEAKRQRKKMRQSAESELSPTDYEALQEKLKKESLRYNYGLKDLNKYWKNRLEQIQYQVSLYSKQLDFLKNERKVRSAALQRYLFDQYTFLNQHGQKKGLLEIFEATSNKTPPAGAGECAAPKLLQYAFSHELKPIAMAEFWWGQSPSSEVRKHKQFYPACRGKCEPILSHMLQGIDMDPNPMLLNPAEGKDISTVYEDEDIVVVNKPAEFLSVPGKNIEDSVWMRMKDQLQYVSGPMVIHRLDMSTSGLMIIAKSKEVHKFIQRQFINRNVTKRYVAILDGIVPVDEGLIDLPLRVDLDNRPQQLICYKYGKSAQTRWEVIERKDGKTRIHFYPITGRTHQLRVHSAHPLGLNIPIVGDDLYGIKSDRLYLHAEYIQFTHPRTRELIHIQVNADF